MNYYMQSTAEHSTGQNLGCRHYFRQLRDVFGVTADPVTVDYVYQVGFHQTNIICYIALFVALLN